MRSTTITLKHRKRADGSVRWFLSVRRPDGQPDTFVDAPFAHLTRLEDRPAVESSPRLTARPSAR